MSVELIATLTARRRERLALVRCGGGTTPITGPDLQ